MYIHQYHCLQYRVVQATVGALEQGHFYNLGLLPVIVQLVVKMILCDQNTTDLYCNTRHEN